MAHKGQLYPVLFRRDWNLNLVTNKNGFANRYIFTPTDSTTGFGTLCRGQHFDCGPATNRFVSEMHWLSQVIRIGPLSFQVELHANINPDRQTYDTTIDIIVQEVGVIATIRRGFAYSTLCNFDRQQFDRTIYWDPHFYDSYPALENSICPPKFWFEGPPH
jgi:hypothetical protein